MSPSDWCLTHGFAPLYKSWSGETLLYDQFSGDTHLLDELCMVVIEVLLRGALPEKALLQEVAGAFDIESESDFSLMLQQRLDALVKLNIVQCPSPRH